MTVIKIHGGAYENVDEVSLDIHSAVLQDGYVDELNNTVKRPALKVWKDDSGGNIGANAITGLYYWPEADFVIAMTATNAFKTVAGGTTSAYTTDALTSSTNPSIFASGVWGSGATYTPKLFVANGKIIGYFADTSTAMADLAGNSPNNATHVAQINGYIVANDNTTGNYQRFYFSSNTDPTSWTTTDFATAESKEDKIVAIHNFWNELYLFGAKVCEVWHDDGVTPFSRIPGAIIETGCSAPYTVVKSGGTIFWLDDKRRFVKLAGRIAQTVSNPYQRVLDSIVTVYDAIAYPISVGGRNWIILNFPSSAPTDFSLCYDYELDQWARWTDWDGSVNTRFKGSCMTVIDPGSVLATATKTDETSTGSSDSTKGTRSWTDPGNATDGDSGTTAEVTNA